MMDYAYPETVTLSLENYDELNTAYQNQDPMTRQERIDSTLQVTATCAGVAVAFAVASGAYYWFKDRADRRSTERRVKAMEQADATLSKIKN